VPLDVADARPLNPATARALRSGGLDMGNEATCTLKIGKQTKAGTALLESSELIFRPAGGSPRLKIPFSAMKSVKALDGRVYLETADTVISLNVGAIAEKWRDKILHPKSRAEKLGIKAGTNVSLLGEFEEAFLTELRASTKAISNGKITASSDLIFLSVNLAKDLPSAIDKTAKAVKGATALWIVYPKGKKEITENDVLTAGRKSGLKDVRVVAFSPTHTALKFVIPIANR
jgi:hypothetical protein